MKELESKNLIKLAIQANMRQFLAENIINDYITDNTTKLFILFHFLSAVSFKLYEYSNLV